jgi:hypothetical protein
LSCNSPEKKPKVEIYSNPFDWKVRYKNADTIKTNEANKKIDDKEMEELIKKWTWNDKITRPLKSSISNAKYSSALLFKTWTWSDENENKAVLTFGKDSLNIHGEKKYIYTVNYDSLRIFTSYDHPGDGFTRGIITKLTKDSLIIKWSTDDNDINKYVPIINK